MSKHTTGSKRPDSGAARSPALFGLRFGAAAAVCVLSGPLVGWLYSSMPAVLMALGAVSLALATAQLAWLVMPPLVPPEARLPPEAGGSAGGQGAGSAGRGDSQGA